MRGFHAPPHHFILYPMGEKMLGPERFEALSRLAKLPISKDEQKRLLPQLEAILEYVGSLKELEEEGAPESSPGVSALRPDEAEPGLEADATLAASPDSASGFFRVPKFLKGGRQ